MRPENRNLVDRLAAEYVLGTLRGRARRRFERWRTTSPLVDERCLFWENRLVHLAKGIEPVTPPAHLWEGIRRRVDLAERRPRHGGWRSFAMAASVVLVVALGALLYWRAFGPQQPTQIATIAASSGVPVWTVEIFGKSGHLTVRSRTPPARAAGRDYELWALPQGGSPVSLGVLPAAGTSQHTLTAVQQQALADAPQVAVSVEPAGGSPTGQPTGAVIFVARLRAAT